MNRRLFNDFNNGIIIEHIVGKGRFFIPEITYRNLHDYILVMDQLEEWATQNNKLDQLEGYIIAALKELDKDNNIENTVWLLNNIIYFAHKDFDFRETFYKKMDLTKILDLAVPILNKNSKKLIEDEFFRNIVFNSCIRSPELAKRLGISVDSVFNKEIKVIIE
jgi:hypothetical protein